MAALCLECQLGSVVPKSINYAAQNMKSFNRVADVTSLFRVFLPPTNMTITVVPLVISEDEAELSEEVINKLCTM